MNIIAKYLPHCIGSWLIISQEKKQLLKSYGWYLNICGGWAHPHGMDHMGGLEIAALKPWQLKYKLVHGSMAELPEKEPIIR